jgi:LruC domain-containing protein
MFNTILGNPIGTSDTTNIVIHFAEPLSNGTFNSETLNPFIIKDQDRSVEIHLAHNRPTDLMDVSLFGADHDASNPSAGLYYVTENNLPWGLEVMSLFDYPIEKSQVISAYNHFGTWAESGGTSYADWYLNLPGYRNANDIFNE